MNLVLDNAPKRPCGEIYSLHPGQSCYRCIVVGSTIFTDKKIFLGKSFKTDVFCKMVRGSTIGDDIG